MHLFGPVHSVHPPFSWFARPARPGGSVDSGSESTACVEWYATGLGSLGLPPIELHADCRPLHTDVHCFATGLGSLGLPPNELHAACKTVYIHKSRDGGVFVASSMPRRQYGSGGAWAPGGSCAQGGVFDSRVVLSAVSSSVCDGVGGSVMFMIGDGSRSMSNDLGIRGAAPILP